MIDHFVTHLRRYQRRGCYQAFETVSRQLIVKCKPSASCFVGNSDRRLSLLAGDEDGTQKSVADLRREREEVGTALSSELCFLLKALLNPSLYHRLVLGLTSQFGHYLQFID